MNIFIVFSRNDFETFREHPGQIENIFWPQVVSDQRAPIIQ